MSSFRSEKMRLVQLFLQSDAARETLIELGNIGAIHFRDLNHEKTAFQRTFVNNVRQCEEMERMLRFVLEHSKDIPKSVRFAGADAEHVTLDEMQIRLEEVEKEILQNDTFFDTLTRQQSEMLELQTVLQRCGKFFTNGRTVRSDTGEDGTISRHLNFIAGLIPSEKLQLFSRVLFRSTRGNMHLQSEILSGKMRDPKSGENVSKAVFIVFFAGERIQQKISRICDTLGATRHPFPERPADQQTMIVSVESRLYDLNNVLESTRNQRDAILSRVARNLDAWFDQVRENKAIYHTMNLFNFDVAHKCLIAEGWCPVDDLDRVRHALARAQEISGAQVPTIMNVIPTKDTPPTFFRSNKFTMAFQEIVDAYGIAQYQEYNPAVFTVITFPFLFGVMFGDAGHGLIMFLIAGYMCLKEKKIGAQKLSEMPNTLFQGRYIILLMGVFAFYCGCIYNECFSVMSRAAPSQWEEAHGNGTQKALAEGVVYPFGVDPGWSHTSNKLNYYNSLKMKMAILLGVTQLVAGVCCKLTNALFFKDKLTLFFVWIPEMIFINSIFGYLCITILIKWLTNYDQTFILNNEAVVTITGTAYGESARYTWKELLIIEGNSNANPTLKDVLKYNMTTCAEHKACSLWKQSPPGLLDMLIKMFMSPGQVSISQQLYPGQGGLQAFLVVLALLSVPVLLLARPLLLRRQHANAGTYGEFQDEHDDEEEAAPASSGGHGGHGEFEFSEVMIHQVIHTIEYVLGCISNTASYLRLWALSLAHAQLSEVFWERLVVAALELEEPSPVFIFVAVSAWAALTFGVLMLMESLSAFLHALRLHWVEFMGKFYGGDGHKYLPLDFSKLPKGATVAEVANDD